MEAMALEDNTEAAVSADANDAESDKVIEQFLTGDKYNSSRRFFFFSKNLDDSRYSIAKKEVDQSQEMRDEINIVKDGLLPVLNENEEEDSDYCCGSVLILIHI